MELSVVILNYNASVFLELCVESCLRATENIVSEIIVADNDSTDDSIERLSSRYRNIKIICLDENYGFSKGNNIAVEQARGKFICLVNPDLIVGESVFENSLAFFKRSEEEVYVERSRNTKANSKTGFLGIRLIDGKGNFLPESKRRIPKPWNALKKLLGFSSSYYDLRIEEKQNAETEILVGAFLFGKKEVYTQLGGLDERYFMYGEDIDLSYTALKNGFQNYYLGTQTAIHFKGESTIKDEKYKERFYGAMSLFYDKHYPRGKFLSSLLKFVLPKIAGKRKPIEHQSFIDLPIMCVSNDQHFKPNWAMRTISYRDLQLSSNENSKLVFDISTLKLGDLMTVIESTNSISNQYRFLTMDRSAYAGSDSSNHRGEVNIF